MDERHFDFYDKQNRLDKQPILQSNLEKQGFEKDNKYILTVKNFGVPVTSILLIMKDSQNRILKMQDELNKNLYNIQLSSSNYNFLKRKFYLLVIYCSIYLLVLGELGYVRCCLAMEKRKHKYFY